MAWGRRRRVGHEKRYEAKQRQVSIGSSFFNFRLSRRCAVARGKGTARKENSAGRRRELKGQESVNVDRQGEKKRSPRVGRAGTFCQARPRHVAPRRPRPPTSHVRSTPFSTRGDHATSISRKGARAPESVVLATQLRRYISFQVYIGLCWIKAPPPPPPGAPRRGYFCSPLSRALVNIIFRRSRPHLLDPAAVLALERVAFVGKLISSTRWRVSTNSARSWSV